MQAKLSQGSGAVGYLATTENDTVGFYGALLVVSDNARPIEFHCTQPVRPKPAQRVLYGATLAPSLLADQIPQALIRKSKSSIGLLLVNDPNLMPFRAQIEIPMALVGGAASTSGHDTHGDVDNSNEQLVIGDLSFFRFENVEIAVSRCHLDDQNVAQAALEGISRSVDVDEPFERLTIAMDETCKGSQAA